MDGPSVETDTVARILPRTESFNWFGAKNELFSLQPVGLQQLKKMKSWK